MNLFLIYFPLALAMMGLYLMMPRGQRPGPAKIGSLVAGLSLTVLLGYLYIHQDTAGYERFFFLLFSFTAILSAGLMITQQRAIYSALFFVMTVLSVAALLLLQQAEFLAFALVIIYGGAILVTYLFVLMLSRQDELEEHDTRARGPFMSVIVGVIFLGGLILLPLNLQEQATQEGTVGADTQTTLVVLNELRGTGSPEALGTELFEHHMLAIQVAGVLLLVAAVGGIALVRHLKLLQ